MVQRAGLISEYRLKAALRAGASWPDGTKGGLISEYRLKAALRAGSTAQRESRSCAKNRDFAAATGSQDKSVLHNLFPNVPGVSYASDSSFNLGRTGPGGIHTACLCVMRRRFAVQFRLARCGRACSAGCTFSERESKRYLLPPSRFVVRTMRDPAPASAEIKAIL